MFSLGIEPSTTKMNGSSSPRAAAKNGFMKSSPPRLGDRTLLCRWTLGMPGIAPSTTSSMLGSDALVTDTVSPSQLIPSEVHRMWISSNPGIIGSTLISSALLHRHRVIHLEGVDEQLLALGDHHVQAPARCAAQREVLQPA